VQHFAEPKDKKKQLLEYLLGAPAFDNVSVD
jgi:hypothetical protein